MNELEKKYIVFDIETTGLNPWYGHPLTCICAKDSDGNTFKKSGVEEENMITEFLIWTKERKDFKLISANGKDFDVPYICARAVVGGIPTSRFFHLIMMEHFDLMELTPRKVSLDNLAILFNCKRKTGTGMNAIYLFNDKKYSQLADYCMNDVEVTEEVYIKYNKQFVKEAAGESLGGFTGGLKA